MKKILIILFSIISVNVFSQGTTCGTATPITLDGPCLLAGTINDATANNPAPSCGTFAQEGWYTFTLAALTNITITGVNANRNLAIQLISGGCGAPTEIACENSQGGGAGTEVLSTSLAAGTYYIKILNVGAGASLTLNSLCLTTTVPGGGGGATCASPLVISSLPYSATGQTTCGFVNNYTSADACGSIYMGGEDFIYRYTPSTNQAIDIALTNSGTYAGIFVFDGCPSAGGTNCVASETNSSGNPTLGCVSLTAGQTYYFMVDTWPAPDCIPFDISITASTSSAPTCNLNYALSSIAHSTTGGGGWTTFAFPDDEFAPSYTDLGFYFCFDGVYYTQTLVSSNGYIVFPGCYSVIPNGDGIPSGYSPYTITTSTPNTTEAPRNSIMLTWQDIDPGAGGTIRYKTTGTAPNRIFILQYNNIPMFSFTCEVDNSLNFTGELRLYETSNNIEFAITNKQICPGWNGGYAVQGLHNFAGNISVEVAGHDYPATYSETNAGYRFVPSCVCTSPLAADILNFDGIQISENENKIIWSTASETDLEKFVLEKSENGIDFINFKEIEAFGNSNVTNDYSISDLLPYDRITYYRLKQLDLDGHFKYSNTVAVSNSQWNGFSILNIFPNPSDGLVNAEIYSSDIFELSLEVKDVSGRTIKNLNFELLDGSNILNFDFSPFDNGIYFLNFINKSNGKSTTLRFIKE